MLELKLADLPPSELASSGQEWQFYISAVRVHIGRSIGRSNPQIENRSLEHHYTKSVSHIEECTYTHGRCNPQIKHRSLEHLYTKSV